VQLLTNNHDPYDRQILTCKPIVIRKGAWIGAGATILPGVTVGRYAIVGAASVVTRDVGDYEVVVGNPARQVRKLDAERFE
jgi:acetyltransferase-like isoleucine patch superfamily enzyme